MCTCICNRHVGVVQDAHALRLRTSTRGTSWRVAVQINMCTHKGDGRYCRSNSYTRAGEAELHRSMYMRQMGRSSIAAKRPGRAVGAPVQICMYGYPKGRMVLSKATATCVESRSKATKHVGSGHSPKIQNAIAQRVDSCSPHFPFPLGGIARAWVASETNP